MRASGLAVDVKLIKVFPESLACPPIPRASGPSPLSKPLAVCAILRGHELT